MEVNIIRSIEEYVVTVDGNQWNNLYIASAKNAKEAINIVWESEFAWKVKEDREEGYRPTAKYELHARSIGSLHNEEGRVICLN